MTWLALPLNEAFEAMLVTFVVSYKIFSLLLVVRHLISIFYADRAMRLDTARCGSMRGSKILVRLGHYLGPLFLLGGRQII